MFTPKRNLPNTEIKKDKTDKSKYFNFKYLKNKQLVFICCIWEDGMGDLGHLVDLSKPEVLHAVSQKLGINISDSSTATCRPGYLIGCQESEKVKRFVVAAMKEAGILREILPPEKLSLEEYMKTHFNDYFDRLLKENPHVTIVPFYKGQQHRWDNALAGAIRSFNSCGYINISTKSVLPKLIGTPLRLTTSILEHGPDIDIPTDLKKWGEKTGGDTRIFTGGLENRSLGFQGNDFRIILKSPSALTLDKKAQVLIDITNKQFIVDLLSSLESKLTIDISTAKNFLEKTLFVPTYFQDDFITRAMIAAISISNITNKYSNIVFHINEKKFTLLDSDKKLLIINGFSKIQMHNPSGVTTIKLEGATGNRCIHIYHCYQFNDKDYHSLYAIGQLFGGCSGDKSLELCLSNFLILFCQIRSYKKVLHKLMQDLIGSKYTKNKGILEFLSLMQAEEISIKKIAELISSDRFIDDWQDIFKNFQLQHNYYDIYPDVILKNLMFYELSASIHNRDNSHAEEILKLFSEEEIENIKSLCCEDRNQKATEMYTYLVLNIPALSTSSAMMCPQQFISLRVQMKL